MSVIDVWIRVKIGNRHVKWNRVHVKQKWRLNLVDLLYDFLFQSYVVNLGKNHNFKVQLKRLHLADLLRFWWIKQTLVA